MTASPPARRPSGQPVGTELHRSRFFALKTCCCAFRKRAGALPGAAPQSLDEALVDAEQPRLAARGGSSIASSVRGRTRSTPAPCSAPAWPGAAIQRPAEHHARAQLSASAIERRHLQRGLVRPARSGSSRRWHAGQAGHLAQHRFARCRCADKRNACHLRRPGVLPLPASSSASRSCPHCVPDQR